MFRGKAKQRPFNSCLSTHEREREREKEKEYSSFILCTDDSSDCVLLYQIVWENEQNVQWLMWDMVLEGMYKTNVQKASDLFSISRVA